MKKSHNNNERNEEEKRRKGHTWSLKKKRSTKLQPEQKVATLIAVAEESHFRNSTSSP